jgi:NADPH2:quinone reductase
LIAIAGAPRIARCEQSMARHVLPLFERGALRAVVDRAFPLAQAGDAHAYIASEASFGKVVLAV